MSSRVPRLPLKSVLPLSEADTTMGLFEHLNELRQRVFKALLALVIATAAGMYLASPVLEYLQTPYGQEFVVLGPTSGVTAYFRIAITVGAVLASPMLTYQILMFIFPGLTGREKRVVLFSLPAIALLLCTGMLFAWFILIPPALGFLEGFQPTLFRPEWTADLYLNFVTTLVFWMGVAFELPLIVFVLAILGLLSATTLLHNWRIAIVLSAAAAAVITPTVDPVNMALVMGPLLALYVFSILLAKAGARLHRAS